MSAFTLSIKSIWKRRLHIRVLDRLIDDRNNKMITIYSKKTIFLRDGKSLATTLRSKYKASDLLDLPDWLLNGWNRNWYEKNLALIEWWFFFFFFLLLLFWVTFPFVCWILRTLHFVIWFFFCFWRMRKDLWEVRFFMLCANSSWTPTAGGRGYHQ